MMHLLFLLSDHINALANKPHQFNKGEAVLDSINFFYHISPYIYKQYDYGKIQKFQLNR